MKKAPSIQVASKFKDKEGLIGAVRALATKDLWVDRLSDKGLDHVSNSKLLRLHETLSTVKNQFGSRALLTEAILKAEKREKDDGYKSRLEKYSTPKLFDHYRSVSKRQKQAS